MAMSVSGMISPECTFTQRPLRMTVSAGERPMATSMRDAADSNQVLGIGGNSLPCCTIVRGGSVGRARAASRKHANATRMVHVDETIHRLDIHGFARIVEHNTGGLPWRRAAFATYSARNCFCGMEYW